MHHYRLIIIRGVRYGVRSDVHTKDAITAIEKRLDEGKELPEWATALEDDEHPF